MTLRGGDDIYRFAALARPGETLVYGRGAEVPRETVRAMRPLVDAGVLHPARVCRDGVCTFTVQRGSASLGGGRIDLSRGLGSAGRGRVRERRVRKSSLTMVFEMIARAARRGAPCPSNSEIAAACGLSGKQAVIYRVRKLVQSGRIAIEYRGPYNQRIVTVLTGPCAGKATCEAAI